MSCMQRQNALGQRAKWILNYGESTARLTPWVTKRTPIKYRVTEHYGQASCFTMFSTMARPSTSSSASVPQITALHILPDSRQICVITRSGDITVASLDDEVPVVRLRFPGSYCRSWCNVPSESQMLRGQLNLASLPHLGVQMKSF